MPLLIRKTLICALLLSLAACSIVMSSTSSGVNPKRLSQCQTRLCLIAAGATPIDAEKTQQGKRYSETFRATMPTSSATRAVMHGVLDVSTFGIWEIVGTPVEAIVKSKKTGYAVNVKYANDGNTIKHISFDF